MRNHAQHAYFKTDFLQRFIQWMDFNNACRMNDLVILIKFKGIYSDNANQTKTFCCITLWTSNVYLSVIPFHPHKLNRIKSKLTVEITKRKKVK